MPNLAELREELAAKSQKLHVVYEQAGQEVDLERVTEIDGTTEQKAAWMRSANEECNRLGAQIESAENLLNIGRLNETLYRRANEPVSRPAMPGAGTQTADPDGELRTFRQKGLMQVLREHKGYRAFRENQSRSVQIELPVDAKALITLTGVNAQATRQGPVDMALEERTVSDLMGQGGTDGNTIEYYEETTVTNAATTVAEGAAKPESALAWTLRTENVRKIATWIPATRESLDDVAWLEGQIRNRLGFMVRRTEEANVLSGDGIAPNLLGILNRSGIQTQAKGADVNPDAIYKAMQKVRGSAGAGFAEPTAVVMNPNDWTLIKLSRTTDGIYIWGNPSEDAVDRIWGLPVRQTTAMTAGTALTGAFRPHAEVVRREGLVVTLSTEHASYFIENKVAILAETRLALAVYRPSAFCKITGIV